MRSSTSVSIDHELGQKNETRTLVNKKLLRSQTHSTINFSVLVQTDGKIARTSTNTEQVRFRYKPQILKRNFTDGKASPKSKNRFLKQREQKDVWANEQKASKARKLVLLLNT